jgi:hypothetical protein
MAADRIRYVGKHEHHLPSGRPVAFGDTFTVGTNTEHDTFDVQPAEAERLIKAGVAVTPDEPAPPARRTTKPDGDNA